MFACDKGISLACLRAVSSNVALYLFKFIFICNLLITRVNVQARAAPSSIHSLRTCAHKGSFAWQM
jgi:hypothetical protein